MSDYLKRLAEALKKREAPMGPDAWDWQQFADTSPTGSVNAPGGVSQPQERDKPRRLGTLLAGASMLPGSSGDLLGPLSDAYMYATEPESRTPGNFALSALGMLPFVPSMAGGKIASAISDAKKSADSGDVSDADYLLGLFGDAAPQVVKNAESLQQAPEVDSIRRAIADARLGAQAKYDDWAGRSYKTNAKKIEFLGDGPGRHESMSIGAINEGRKRGTLNSLSGDIEALDRLGLDISTNEGGQLLAKQLQDTMQRAQQAVASGSYPNKTADQLFEQMILSELGISGGRKGTVTSNGVSRALLNAVKSTQ